jgi:hypothetical protein
MKNFFSRIQWKLTLSYAIVTAGTVIFLAFILAGAAAMAENAPTGQQPDLGQPVLVEDRVSGQYPLPGQRGKGALQSWLEKVRKNGFDSRDFQSYTGQHADRGSANLRAGPKSQDFGDGTRRAQPGWEGFLT